MTTQTLPLLPGSGRENLKKTARVLGIALQAVFSVLKTNSRPIRRNFQEHGYTLVGFGCISGASFLHSAFTGLIVTGILLLVFEWKVSD